MIRLWIVVDDLVRNVRLHLVHVVLMTLRVPDRSLMNLRVSRLE